MKTVMRESCNFELCSLSEEEAERREKIHLGRFAAFWFSTFTMYFHTIKSLVGDENTRRWMV